MIALQALNGVSGFWAGARAVHMTSCAALASVFVFERAIVRRYGAIPKRGWIIGISLGFVVLSGLAWLAAVTIDMTGLPPSEALSRVNIASVLGTTHFGCLWQARLGMLVATPIVWGLLRLIRRGKPGDAMLLTSVALLGSLAWAGHGTEGSWPITHRVADAAHLLIIAIWPGGLFPIWLMLSQPSDAATLTTIVNRFSKLALLSVFILIGSGWINSWMLIGSWRGLIDTAYGQTLLVKIALLIAMLALGAVNLLYLRPRIAEKPRAMRMLRWNVAIETVLTLGLMLVVGYLGLLAPPVDV